MNNLRRLFRPLVLAIAIGCSTCRADLIVQHLGTTDPTTEGWTEIPGNGGGVAVGPIDDGGMPAWFADDNSTESGSTFIYEQIISAADIEQGNSVGWTLNTTLRVASDEELSFDGSPFLTYIDGTTAWRMYFGLNEVGDTFVRLYTSPTTGPVHTIAGNATYNTFSLVFWP